MVLLLILFIFYVVPFVGNYLFMRWYHKTQDKMVWTNGESWLCILISSLPILNIIVILITLVFLIRGKLADKKYWEKESKW